MHSLLYCSSLASLREEVMRSLIHSLNLPCSHVSGLCLYTPARRRVLRRYCGWPSGLRWKHRKKLRL
ncbi:unnamed protein product [Litomosoides sigmodontis]|uniref:Uncharacterized protein n=1 Tax=Litomosoides sigmodontis TaxID=42156 RepID=A0A3P6U1K4_LITSI|nr:unnamed protein product [Litomosoides sigmodontis]